MTTTEYRAVKAFHFSAMKDLEVSPYRYWYLHINPDAPERKESPELRFGNALHCAVLHSPEVFDANYACEPNWDSVEGLLDTVDDMKQWLTERGIKPKGTVKDGFITQVLDADPEAKVKQVMKRKLSAQNQGKTILGFDDWTRLTGCVQSLRSEPRVNELLSAGEAEMPLFWQDDDTGVPLKACLDWMHPECTVDLKTFTVKRRGSVDEAVSDAIWNEGYLKQGYVYSQGRSVIEHQPMSKPFINIFVESDPPHEVRIRKFQYGSDLYWTQTQMDVRRLVRLYADCVERFGDKPWRDAQEIEPMRDEHYRQLGWS